MGYAAQRSQFCPVGGLRDVMNNRGSHLLLTYLAVIAIALSVMSFIGLALGSFIASVVNKEFNVNLLVSTQNTLGHL